MLYTTHIYLEVLKSFLNNTSAQKFQYIVNNLINYWLQEITLAQYNYLFYILRLAIFAKYSVKEL